MDVVLNGPNENAKDSGKRLVSIAGVNTDGHLNVDTYWQDQSTEPVIINFNKINNQTTLNGAVGLHVPDIIVTSATGISVGSYIILFHPGSLRFSTFYAVGVAGTTITLDSPTDFAYPDGTFVDIGITDLSVDGSSAVQIFGLRGLGSPPGVELTFHLTRVIFQCTCASPVALNLFGDLAALTNGLLLRARNGKTKNIFNVKTNGDLAGIMYDWTPYQATNPVQGIDGFVSRLTFGGPSKIGVVIELPVGEDLELHVHDNLTGLTSFHVIAEGHIVEAIGA